MPRRPSPLLCLPLLVLAGGCVQRTLQIDSNPAGALVYLNGEEVGRTPMRKNFVWYGTYDVQIRKEGYQTLTKRTRVWAPWWQVPPFDFFAELTPLPLEDKHFVHYRLRPVDEQQTEPAQILTRAANMRGRLRSSRFTRRPGAGPTPTTAPAAGAAGP